MKHIIFFFIVLLTIDAFSEIAVKTILKARFGEKKGEFGTEDTGEPGHGIAYPHAIFIANNRINISDCHNQRIQIANIITPQWEIIPEGQNEEIYTTSCDKIVYVSKAGTLIIEGGIIYKPEIQKWKLFPKLNRLKIIVKIGKNFLVRTSEAFLVIDSTFSHVTSIEKSSIRDSVILINQFVVFIKTKRMLFSDKYLRLQEIANSQYDLLTDTVPEQINAFPLPDSLELHASCRPRCNMTIIAYDENLNNYWLAYDDSLNFDGESKTGICIYNRLGQRLKFFIEPLPPKGWHYGADHTICVSPEGRIFRMLYHETEGIQVVEYLWKDDKKDKEKKKK